MHELTLVTLQLPETKDDIFSKAFDAAIAEKKHYLEDNKEFLEKNYFFDMFYGRLCLCENHFSRNVESAIEKVLEPYNEQTENEAYLEFEDYTEELKKEYETECIDCAKLPNGLVIPLCDIPGKKKFDIRDGKIYQKQFGRLKNDKRSKKAKSIIALPQYPIKKAFKSFDAYAEYYGFYYFEEYQGYGYLYNPNAFYDWYQIGGRWPRLFLVKDTCTECSIGERSWRDREDEYSAPEGYMWVVAARKKDIEWRVMEEWKKTEAIKKYVEYKSIFDSAAIPKYSGFRIEGNKLMYCSSILYIDGETEETYLKRKCITNNKNKYKLYLSAILHDGVYKNFYDDLEYCKNQKRYQKLKKTRESKWSKMIDKFIDSLSDDTVLVGVDCHI